jgi:hypothetical protein
MKTYGGVSVYIHVFLTSAPVAGEWSTSHHGPFTPEEVASGTHWIGGWVGPKTGLDDMERRKILPLLRFELRPLSRPARSQSLSRLCNIYFYFADTLRTLWDFIPLLKFLFLRTCFNPILVYQLFECHTEEFKVPLVLHIPRLKNTFL